MTGIDLTQAHYAQEAWNLRAAAHLALNAAPLRAKLATFVNEGGEIDWAWVDSPAVRAVRGLGPVPDSAQG